jgi:hypothetical protein
MEQESEPELVLYTQCTVAGVVACKGTAVSPVAGVVACKGTAVSPVAGVGVELQCCNSLLDSPSHFQQLYLHCCR